MSNLSLSEGWFDWPDQKLGREILRIWILDQLERRGADHTENNINHLITLARDLESDGLDDIEIAKIIKLAARGEYDKAGSMLKAFSLRSVEASIYKDEAESGRRKQSLIASKNRTKKPMKAIVQDSMRRFKNEHRTFDDYLEAAFNGSIEDIELRKLDLKGVERYEVDSLSLETQERKSRKTLQNWWSDCDKIVKPN